MHATHGEYRMFHERAETSHRIRRFLAGLAPWFARMTLAAIFLLCLARTLTDRFHWSQYLFWVPTLVVCSFAAGSLAFSHLLSILARSERVIWSRRIGWLLTCAGFLYAFTLEWSGGGAQTVPPREQRLRFVFWNFNTSGDPGWETPAIDQGPDVVVVRAGACTHPEGLRRRMGENAFFCWDLGFMVASKLPIKAFGTGPLNVEQGMGLDPRADDLIRRGRDPGRAMWLILDAKSRLSRDLVVWLVDMPSDLSLWRGKAMRAAAQALEAGPRAWYIADELDRWVEAPDFRRPAKPDPDLIVGDFNTPHGALSIGAISRGWPSAYDQAGLGYAATFPRPFPLWQLDQAFSGPQIRVCDHQIIDPGAGTHRMVVLDLENPARP